MNQRSLTCNSALKCVRSTYALVRFVSVAVMGFVTFAQGEGAALCARARIEIDQEPAFERQGFGARMNVENRVTAALENIYVVIDFADRHGKPVVSTSNPNDTRSKFFIGEINLRLPASLLLC